MNEFIEDVVLKNLNANDIINLKCPLCHNLLSRAYGAHFEKKKHYFNLKYKSQYCKIDLYTNKIKNTNHQTFKFSLYCSSKCHYLSNERFHINFNFDKIFTVTSFELYLLQDSINSKIFYYNNALNLSFYEINNEREHNLKLDIFDFKIYSKEQLSNYLRDYYMFM